MPRGKKPPGAAPDPRGGPRQGVQGHSYDNRSDLRGNARSQPVQSAPGQGYGARAAQERAQQAVPLPSQPGPPAPQPGAGGPFQPSISADQVPNLTDPTRRPDEPVTAGLPFGPGPGPTQDQTRPPNPVAEQVRALLMAHPTPELRELLTQIELGG